MIYDRVTIFVAKCEFRIGRRTAFIRFPIEFIAAVVFALFLLGCEKDVIIIDFRAQYVIPFLNEQYTRLGAGMRFERCFRVAPRQQEYGIVLQYIRGWPRCCC